MVYVKSLEKVMPKNGDIITNELGCFFRRWKDWKKKK